MGESMTTYYTMDIATIISEYLYGTVTPPENLEDRLRDASITTGPTLDVDVANYMASCGRFSSPFQTTVVQKFFDGTLDLSHYSPDQSGATSVSFDQLMLDGVASNRTGRFILVSTRSELPRLIGPCVPSLTAQPNSCCRLKLSS